MPPYQPRRRGPSKPLKVSYEDIATLTMLSTRTVREYARNKFDATSLDDVVRFINERRIRLNRPPIGTCPVVIIRNGPICRQPEQLADALQTGLIQLTNTLHDNNCLCPINIPATAANCFPPIPCQFDAAQNHYYLDMTAPQGMRS